MITIDIDKTHSGNVLIGRQGEHDFQEIGFLMGQWAARYPAGTVTVVYERPDGETYPVVTAARPGSVVWKPTLADLSVAGAGRLEARITADGGLGKSATVPVTIAPAIGAAGNVPVSPIPDWTYTVAENARRAESAAASAETTLAAVGETVETALHQAKESGEFDGPPGEKGDQGQPGEPGAVISETEPEPYSDGTHPLWFYPQGEGITAETLGADPLGAAEAALEGAKSYTDTQLEKQKIPKPLSYDYMPPGYLNWTDLRDKPFESVEIFEGVLEEETLSFAATEEPFAIDCVAETEVTASALSDGTYLLVNPFQKNDGTELVPPAVTDMTYRVRFDGAVYDCLCQMTVLETGESYPVLGNAGLINAGGDSGEPFGLLWLGSDKILYAAADDAAHVFSLGMLLPAGSIFLEKPAEGTFPAAVGPLHRVLFDTVAYECECIPLMNGLCWMGNGALLGIPWAVGEEPFGVLWYDGRWFLAAETAGDHRFAVESAAGRVSRIAQSSLPFYTRKKKKVVLSETVTTALISNGQIRSDMMLYEELPHQFVIGQDYLVSYDGQVYECTCFAFNGRAASPSLGNSALGGLEEDVQGKGEPFLMTRLSKYWLHYTREAGEHSALVETRVDEAVPLDPQYIPVLDALVLRSADEGSGKLFRISVTDEGNLSAAEIL